MEIGKWKSMEISREVNSSMERKRQEKRKKFQPTQRK
jgi:hypothetical protein